MIALRVIDQLKLGAETLCYMHVVAVFRVSFSNLRGDKLLAGHLKPFHQACDTFP